MNKNICLCLYGQTRFDDQTLDSIKNNIIIPNNIKDIFIHTWIYEDGEKFNPFSPDNGRGSGIFYSNQILKMLDFFKPKKIFLEKNIFDLNDNNTSMKSLFTSISKVINLKKQFEIEKNKKYDTVISCRMDLVFSCIIQTNHIKNSYFYVKNRPGGFGKGINDWFCICSSDVSNVYGETIENIDFFKPPEENLLNNLLKNNVKIDFIDNVFSIKRSSGDFTN